MVSKRSLYVNPVEYVCVGPLIHQPSVTKRPHVEVRQVHQSRQGPRVFRCHLPDDSRGKRVPIRTLFPVCGASSRGPEVTLTEVCTESGCNCAKQHWVWSHRSDEDNLYIREFIDQCARPSDHLSPERKQVLNLERKGCVNA